jgi:hypothetical protein
MSSLKICNQNCGGSLGGEGGRVRGRGKSAYHQPRTSVDKHFAPRDQKGDFQVSKGGDSLCEQKGKRCKGAMGELAIDVSVGCDMHSYVCICVNPNPCGWEHI